MKSTSKLVDSKPRPQADAPLRSRKTAPWTVKDSQRRHHMASAALRAMTMRTNAKTTGAVMMRDYTPSGHTTGLVIGGTGPKGGVSSDPAVTAMYFVRRIMEWKPPPPVTVYDAAGKPIATITVDPVTKKRTRTPISEGP